MYVLHTYPSSQWEKGRRCSRHNQRFFLGFFHLFVFAASLCNVQRWQNFIIVKSEQIILTCSSEWPSGCAEAEGFKQAKK